jgi:SAM-dependent methyltransferase
MIRSMVDSALPLVRKLRKRGRKLFRMAAPAPNYQPGCKYHGRGVEHLDSKLASAGLPDVTTLIEKCLERKGHCKVLETGCGEGRLLLELLHRFGTRIELHGSNVGDWPVMFGKNPLQRSNEHYHVMPVERLRTLPPPTIHTADVQELSAFPVRDFDFIFSQAMMQHVPDKARGLEQSATLLSSDGMFVHELDRSIFSTLTCPDSRSTLAPRAFRPSRTCASVGSRSSIVIGWACPAISLCIGRPSRRSRSDSRSIASRRCACARSPRATSRFACGAHAASTASRRDPQANEPERAGVTIPAPRV